MIVYLASPNTQQQAEHVEGMPVLLSYTLYSNWMDRYQATFRRILIDSGAFTEFESGGQVSLDDYQEWAARWNGHADAVAGLDDMGGDWRRSLRNYEAFPGGFPTFHVTDPPELLADLLPFAQATGWLGVGMCGQQHVDVAGKEKWLRQTLDRVPEGIHVHGWALRAYTHVRRLDSVDSTNWWRDGMAIRQQLPWLTYGEALEIVVKRYQRWQRSIVDPDVQPDLFTVEEASQP